MVPESVELVRYHETFKLRIAQRRPTKAYQRLSPLNLTVQIDSDISLTHLSRNVYSA